MKHEGSEVAPFENFDLWVSKFDLQICAMCAEDSFVVLLYHYRRCLWSVIFHLPLTWKYHPHSYKHCFVLKFVIDLPCINSK